MNLYKSIFINNKASNLNNINPTKFKTIIQNQLIENKYTKAVAISEIDHQIAINQIKKVNGSSKIFIILVLNCLLF